MTFQVDGDKEPKRILLGDKTPTGSGLYAKLPSTTACFSSIRPLEAALDKPTFDLRDKTALKFDQAKVTSLELVSAAQTIRLEKSGDEWKLVKPMQAPADFVSVNGVLGQLQSAQMTALKERPEDIKDLKQYGLDKPEVVATLGMGASPVTFELGKEADPGSVWGRDPSKAAVFSVNNGVAKELQKKVEDFRRKERLRVPALQHDALRDYARQRDARVRAGQGHRRRTPSTRGSRSRRRRRPSTPATSKARCSTSRTCAPTSFAATAGAATGHDNPAAIIAVKFDDGKKEERVVVGTAGSDVFATRADQPGALKVETGKYDDAIKKLDAVQ